MKKDLCELLTVKIYNVKVCQSEVALVKIQSEVALVKIQSEVAEVKIQSVK